METPAQAATGLASLLAQSASDRDDVSEAFADADGCGSQLAGDQQVFRQAGSSRSQLLTTLKAGDFGASLPPAMVDDLVTAWQASVTVDRDYAEWAGDLRTAGCGTSTQSDPHYIAASQPNIRATHFKEAFVGQWDAVARKYGLKTYSQGEL